MTTFDDRERAFENLFAHDQELAFRAEARRNREIGLWAAHQLGRSDAEAAAYATEILAAAVERGRAGVLAKILGDFGHHGLHVTEHQILRRMDELLADAVEHVKRD